MANFGKPGLLSWWKISVSSFRGYLSHFWRVMANETIEWQSALLPFKFEQFCSNVGGWIFCLQPEGWWTESSISDDAGGWEFGFGFLVPDTFHSSEIVQNGFSRGYFWFSIHSWWEQAKKMTLKFFLPKGGSCLSHFIGSRVVQNAFFRGYSRFYIHFWPKNAQKTTLKFWTFFGPRHLPLLLRW